MVVAIQQYRVEQPQKGDVGGGDNIPGPMVQLQFAFDTAGFLLPQWLSCLEENLNWVLMLRFALRLWL